jgi:hypothetical protein
MTYKKRMKIHKGYSGALPLKKDIHEELEDRKGEIRRPAHKKDRQEKLYYTKRVIWGPTPKMDRQE